MNDLIGPGPQRLLADMGIPEELLMIFSTTTTFFVPCYHKNRNKESDAIRLPCTTFGWEASQRRLIRK